jgi:hypothetical protein
LPTEEQWEWACRAGTATPFFYGDHDADYTPYANLGDIRLREYAACTARGSYTRAEVITNPSPFDDWVPRDTRSTTGISCRRRWAAMQAEPLEPARHARQRVGMDPQRGAGRAHGRSRRLLARPPPPRRLTSYRFRSTIARTTRYSTSASA